MEVLFDNLPPLKKAKIGFSDSNPPCHLDYKDIYFSREGGLQESQTVFLKANNFPERFSTKNHIVIGELGFGMGLNFLTTWESWKKSRKSCRLTFISVEKEPPELAHLQKVHESFPKLAPLSSKLFNQFPDFVPGWHPIDLENNLRLLLGFGDALHLLNNLQATIDAWYFDGFTPSLNEDLWNSDIFQRVATLSNAGATFGTYTVAGFVKRNLESAGFQTQKVAGFGRKKERLIGSLKNKDLKEYPTSKDNVLVIGGGLAGASVAHALAQKGRRVTIIESHTIGSGASGNSAGILKPTISHHPTIPSLLSLSAYGFSRRLIQELSLKHDIPHDFSGTIQLEPTENLTQKIIPSLQNHPWPSKDIRVITSEEASDYCGNKINQGGLLFSQGGWVSPIKLCHALTQSSLINIESNHEVINFEKHDSLWKVSTKQGAVFQGSELVFACAWQAQKFFPWIPLETVRGQILYLPPSNHSLKIPVSFGSYLIPHPNGLVAGASFDKKNQSLEFLDRESQEILDQVSQHLPSFPSPQKLPQQGRVALRTFAKDHVQIVGGIPDINSHLTEPPLSGLYIVTALASRGLLWAPLLGDLLASHIERHPSPVSTFLSDKLEPRRFFLRQSKKKH